jgi:hypothetical protein
MLEVGAGVGVGLAVGLGEGEGDGDAVGCGVGLAVGAGVGIRVGLEVGAVVGARVGSAVLSMHVDAPWSEYLPRGQLEHDDATELENLPAGQRAQIEILLRKQWADVKSDGTHKSTKSDWLHAG